MTGRSMALLFALTLVFGAAAPAQAQTCSQGETKFQNGVQYTCVCGRTASGATACRWQAD